MNAARTDARLRLLAMLQAKLAGDETAWAALWPEYAEDVADILVASIELLSQTIADTDDPAEEIARLRALVLESDRG